MLTPGEGPVLRVDDEGAVFAETPFPDVLAITRALLRSPWKRGMSWTDDLVDFRLKNGRWIYRIVESDTARDLVIGTIVYRDEWPC